MTLSISDPAAADPRGILSKQDEGAPVAAVSCRKPWVSPVISQEEEFSTYSLNCKQGPACTNQNLVKS